MRRHRTVLSAALLTLVMLGTDLASPAAADPPPHAPSSPPLTLGTGGIGHSPLTPHEQMRQPRPHATITLTGTRSIAWVKTANTSPSPMRTHHD